MYYRNIIGGENHSYPKFNESALDLQCAFYIPLNKHAGTTQISFNYD